MADLSFLTRIPIAHRGLHDGNMAVPENSWAAFDAAITKGFAIELDVQLSRDGVAVVFHDETLERLCGRPDKVADLDAAALKTITIAGTEQVIEPLADIIGRIDARVPVIVEMKDNGPRNPELAKDVAAVLKRAPRDVAAMSFAQDLVADFIDRAPEIPAGLTAEGTSDAALDLHSDFMASDIGQHVAFISYNVMHLPNRFVAQMREQRHLPVITWTVRTPEMKAHSDAHADQITFEGFEPAIAP